MLNDQALGVRNVADIRRNHVPLLAHSHESVHVVRGDHGHHALLGLGAEDFRCGHVVRAQVHLVQVDVHAAIASCCQLGGGTGKTSSAEVLNTHHNASVVELQAALDEYLLCERVAHLHGRKLALCTLLEGSGAQHGYAADAVQTSAGSEEDHAVASTGGKGQFKVIDLQRAHAQGVDQRVTGVGSVKDSLATDVGQS